MDDEDTQYDAELVRFVFDLGKMDPLRMLVRAQAHIEQSLRHFIVAAAPSPQNVGLQRLDFDGTVRLALILGLNAEVKPALKALGVLQGTFARSIDAEFGSQEADNFYNVLSPAMKQVLREVYQEFRVEQNLGEFKRQPPARRLVWFLIGIWSAILAERKHGPIPNENAGVLPPGYIGELESRRVSFIRLLDDADDLQLVIRGHSYLDVELREFIFAVAPQPRAVRNSNFDYAGALGLAMTLGLDPSLAAGLTAVGALRNKFAHSVDMELTGHEAKKIYEKLDTSVRTGAQQAWATTHQKYPDNGRAESLLEAAPRDLLATSMSMLFLGIMLGQLKHRRGLIEWRRDST
ncbi:MAG: hypothetical protein ABIL01_35905 [Pseudomonadota bacterium]